MDAALLARLAALRVSLQAAEASAAGVPPTVGDATRGMEAVVESCRALELLVAKEAEAASKKRKQWGEMKDKAHRVQAQVKDIVTDFWKNKAEENSREVEALRSSNAGLEAKLSAAMARNGQLESEVQASKKRLVEVEVEDELVLLRRALVEEINAKKRSARLAVASAARHVSQKS